MAKEPNQRAVTKKHLARLERERIQQRYLLIAMGAVLILIVSIIVYGVLDQTIIKNLRPVAKVGSTNISTASFQKEVRFQRSRLIDQLTQFASDQFYLQIYGSYVQQLYSELQSPAALGQNVLDSLIEDELIRREAEKRGITVTEAELDQAFEAAFGFYENGTPTPTITATSFSTSTLSPQQEAFFPPTATAGPTEEPTAEPTATEAPVTATPEVTATAAAELTPTPDYTPTITSTPTPYTREEFTKNVDAFVTNLDVVEYTEKDLRELIRRQLLRTKVFDAITQDVETSAEQVWARHILVATEEEAQQVLDRLNQGESFASLASELSTDTSNSIQGGDLGWFTRGQMVGPFEEAVFGLEVGEISQPVQTEFGYHIIQALGHEVRPLTEQQLDAARQAAYQEWLDNAKTENVVQTYDNWMDDVPVEPTLDPQLESILAQFLQPAQNPLEDLDLTLPTVEPLTAEPTAEQ